jgi:hypothetical protein
MSQHDMNIANQSFPNTRGDINNALAALVSQSSGATAPSTTFANQMWYDTANNFLKMRNEADDAWITIAYLDQSADEVEFRTACVQAIDSAGIALKTDEGTSRLTISDAGAVDVVGTLTAARGIGDTQTASITGATTLDFATYQNFVLTLTGAVTLSNPTTESTGQSGFIVFIQDGTGGRTVSPSGTDYETVGGGGITLSSAASARDLVPYVVSASGSILLGTPQLAFS